MTEHGRGTAELPTGTTSMGEGAELYRSRVRDPHSPQQGRTQPFIALDWGEWIINSS